jgi:hypothetical protein
MSSAAVPSTARSKGKPTLASLQKELKYLRERVEDLEDLRALNEAIERNGKQKLIPWEQARKDLGLDG